MLQYTPEALFDIISKQKSFYVIFPRLFFFHLKCLIEKYNILTSFISCETLFFFNLLFVRYTDNNNNKNPTLIL